MIAKVAYGRRCQMGDVHTTHMRSGLGRVREYGVSFASPPPPSFWYIVSLDDKNPINILDWKTIDDIDTIKSAFNRIERERSASGLKTLGRNVTFDSKFDAFKRALALAAIEGNALQSGADGAAGDRCSFLLCNARQ